MADGVSPTSDAPALPPLARDVLSTRSSVRAQRDLFFVKELMPLRRRLAGIALVVHSALFTLMALGGLSGARLAAMIGVLLFGIVAQSGIQYWITRTGRAELGYLIANVVGQSCVAAHLALSGGLASPMTPVLGMVVVLIALLCSGHRYAVYLALSLVAHVALLVSMPAAWTGPPIATGYHHAGFALTLAWVLLVAHLVGARLAGAAQHAAEAMEAMRQERIDEAEAHSRRLQAVSARVAHELKNPLAAIKGLVQLVARGVSEPKAQERLDVVQGEIERMGVILREYLSFSRPLEDLAPVRVELGELVRDMAAVVGGRAETARIRLETVIRDVAVTADPRRLKEALLNVLSNAIDASPGGGLVRLECRPGDGGGGVLEITDSGRGLTPEQLQKVGTTYFTTRAEGTGLGVVLVVGVMAQHGGTVHYASRAGRGTRVTLTLPATPRTVAPGAVVLSVESLAPEAS